MKVHDTRRAHDYWTNHHNGKPSRAFRKLCNKRARRQAETVVQVQIDGEWLDVVL
jgi:hypothetical protein